MEVVTAQRKNECSALNADVVLTNCHIFLTLHLLDVTKIGGRINSSGISAARDLSIRSYNIFLNIVSCQTRQRFNFS